MENYLTVQKLYDRLLTLHQDAVVHLSLDPRKTDWFTRFTRHDLDDWNFMDIDYRYTSTKVSVLVEQLKPHLEKRGGYPVTRLRDVILDTEFKLQLRYDCELTRHKDLLETPFNPSYKPSRDQILPKVKAVLADQPTEEFLGAWYREKGCGYEYEFFLIGGTCYDRKELLDCFPSLSQQPDWLRLFEKSQVAGITLHHCKFYAKEMKNNFGPVPSKVDQMLATLTSQ